MAGTGLFSEILDGEAYKYYADGEWKKSSSGKLVPIINPTTRKVHYKVQGDHLSSLINHHVHVVVFNFAWLLCFSCFVLQNYNYPLFGCHSLYTRRGQQGYRNCENCTEVVGKDSTLEAS